MNSKRLICMRSIKENVEADFSRKLNTVIFLRITNSLYLRQNVEYCDFYLN